MFIPLPANSLMQSARHVTTYVHILFGSHSTNTMPMTPAAQNTEATAFQHTGTLYILWFSMKMDVSAALKWNGKPMSHITTLIWDTFCSLCLRCTNCQKTMNHLKIIDGPECWHKDIPQWGPTNLSCLAKVSPSICAHLLYVQNYILTLTVLTWRTWLAPNNTSRWQMRFNSVFKGLKRVQQIFTAEFNLYTEGWIRKPRTNFGEKTFVTTIWLL